VRTAETREKAEEVGKNEEQTAEDKVDEQLWREKRGRLMLITIAPLLY